MKIRPVKTRPVIRVKKRAAVYAVQPVIMVVDPGKSGGFVWNDRQGTMHAATMPDTLPMLANLIRDAAPDFFLMEKVRSSPQMGTVSAFTFGRGVGSLEGMLTYAKIFWREATPQTWMKHHQLGRVKDHENVRLWKKYLVTQARKKVPALFRGLGITESLKIADAVLIWYFAKHVFSLYGFKTHAKV